MSGQTFGRFAHPLVPKYLGFRNPLLEKLEAPGWQIWVLWMKNMNHVVEEHESYMNHPAQNIKIYSSSGWSTLRLLCCFVWMLSISQKFVIFAWIVFACSFELLGQRNLKASSLSYNTHKYPNHAYWVFEVFGKVQRWCSIAESIQNIIPIILAVYKFCQTFRNDPPFPTTIDENTNSSSTCCDSLL